MLRGGELHALCSSTRIPRILPAAWPVPLSDCPPGIFEYQGEFCLKTEYFNEQGFEDVYILDTGEVFWGGAGTQEKRSLLMVRPCKVVDGD